MKFLWWSFCFFEWCQQSVSVKVLQWVIHLVFKLISNTQLLNTAIQIHGGQAVACQFICNICSLSNTFLYDFPPSHPTFYSLWHLRTFLLTSVTNILLAPENVRTDIHICQCHSSQIHICVAYWNCVAGLSTHRWTRSELVAIFIVFYFYTFWEELCMQECMLRKHPATKLLI